jgi:hypothetical protein
MVLAGAVLLSLSGCGGSGNQYEISGSVKFRGQPLPDGMIRFIPASGEGTQSGAVITGGKYVVPKSHGLAPGSYKVQIYQGATNQEAAEDAGMPDSGRPDPIPAKYNEQTTLAVEVKPGGPYTFDFDLSDK